MVLPIDPETSARLATRLAQRLEDDPDFFANVLRLYRDGEGLDDDGLASSLGIHRDRLPHLALCRRPRANLFREDVEAVAERFDLDPVRLADLVRQADVLTAFARAPSAGAGSDAGTGAGMLAAARDRAAEERANYDAEQEDGASDTPKRGEPNGGGGDGDTGGAR